MGKHKLARARDIALALPGVSERASHGAPCFFIAGKRPLCYYHDNHRRDGRISIWCPATADYQDATLRVRSGQVFSP